MEFKVLKAKTIDGTRYELSKSVDVLGDVCFYLTKDLWGGAKKTLRTFYNHEEAVKAFNEKIERSK